MNIAVRFYSRGGNTEKVAAAIAKSAGVTEQSCSQAIAEPVDLLFLGGSVYGFGLDDSTKNFIQSLDPAFVKKAAVFGTSAIVKSGNNEMLKLLKEKGISVVEKSFYCRGEFKFMHKGHPNEADLKNAASFAGEIIRGIEGGSI